MRLIARVEIDEGRRLPSRLIVSGLVLACVSIALGPGTGGMVLAVSTAVVGAVAVLLRTMMPQSTQPAAVTVGAPLLDFTALDDSGKPFEIASLKGRPILMKFFRGHW
jgi:cytochrome oxidase Cu insertion factor (SCO1/SenC/PrrC family)